jgi:hypothetical protein
MCARKAPARGANGSRVSKDTHPADRLDPRNTIGIAQGQSLKPRPMPRDMEFMLDLSRRPVAIQLWECEAWSIGAPDDILMLPGDRWAVGRWDERSRRYSPHPDGGGFRLIEVTRGDIIALCNLQDRMYPIKILREMSAAHVAPAASAISTSAGSDSEAADEGKSHSHPPRLTQAIMDILRTLGEAKGRLTRERLLEAMIKASRQRGESTVANALPELGRAGWVDNRQDVDPTGYAITEKGRLILKEAKARCL